MGRRPYFGHFLHILTQNGGLGVVLPKKAVFWEFLGVLGRSGFEKGQKRAKKVKKGEKREKGGSKRGSVQNTISLYFAM